MSGSSTVVKVLLPAAAIAVLATASVPSTASACRMATADTSQRAGVSGPPLPIGYSGCIDDQIGAWSRDFRAWQDGVTPDPPPVEDPPPLDPPGPSKPECDLDDPRGPDGCAAHDTAPFVYQATNPADSSQISNVCTVTLDGATPSDDFATGRIRFRTRADCTANLRGITIDTKLVDALGNTKGSVATYTCHACVGSEVSTGIGDVSGLGDNAYEVVTTVRMVLEEGQPPGDPWALTPGAPPSDTSNGNCVPGGTIVKCEIRLATKATRM